MFKYSITLRWSDEDEGYIAEIPELPGANAIGETPEEAVTEVKVVADMFLDIMKEDGEPIPKPELMNQFSGQLRLRMPKSLHARLASRAKMEGISLNSIITYLLSSSLERKIVSDVLPSEAGKITKDKLPSNETSHPLFFTEQEMIDAHYVDKLLRVLGATNQPVDQMIRKSDEEEIIVHKPHSKLPTRKTVHVTEHKKK